MSALTQQLVDLLRGRQVERMFALWQAAPAVEREVESAKRVVAAALAQRGDLAHAHQMLSELASRSDAEPTSLLLAGRVAFDFADFGASVSHFERLVKKEPANVDAWRWLADAALRSRQPHRALAGAEAHVLRFALDPELAIRHASLLALSSRCDEALIAFERILARWPGHAVAGPAFAEFVLREFPLDAESLLERNDWRPNDGALSGALVRALLWLPAWYESAESARRWRERLLSNLKLLERLATESTLTGDERACCLATTPFFAAYHDADVTEIQVAWGNFVEAVVAPLRSRFPCASQPKRLRRVGVVSNRLTDSSAGRFFNPWLPLLQSAGFEVNLYALGNFDHVTEELSRQFRLQRFPVDDASAWSDLATCLHADANDVLLYPEPQGSQLIQLIAGIRFAPIQCAAFGNPLSTGLRTIDYFLVPDDSEVAEPEPYYRERVVRLSGLGISAPVVPAATRRDRSAFGLRTSDHVVLVSQQLQKWTPEFVAAVLEVLTRDPLSVLVYFGVASGVSVRAFNTYLRRCFALANLSFAARAREVGMLSREDYLSLHCCADVALDTFGFSGGSSTLDAVSVNLPVISLEGDYLRCRQSASILRAHGQSRNVVTSSQDFVAVALDRLGQKRPIAIASGAPKPVEAKSGNGRVFESVASFLTTLQAAD